MYKKKKKKKKEKPQLLCYLATLPIIKKQEYGVLILSSDAMIF
jgi:hypothetical protein